MKDFLPFSKPALGEEEISAVSLVLRSNWITTGPQNQALEQEFCQVTGARHAVAVCSATAGMHVTLMALGIGPGDEVITPSMTWVSTLNIITLLGATPVMIDVACDTLMVTPEEIQAAITPRTKAIIPVHFAGAPVDLEPIRALAQQNGITLIEDAAHAIGTVYRDEFIGQRGTVIFSFHAIKNITCAEGGMVVTDDDCLAERIRSLKFHGLGLDAYDRQTYGRVPQAEVVTPGYKYNLTDIHAAIARVQLRKLSMLNAQRAKLAAYYQQQLALHDLPLSTLKAPDWPHQHAWHLFIVRCDEACCGINRDQLMLALKEHNIGCGLHFRAVHTQKYYRENYPQLQLPQTEWNSQRICSLPLFPDMNEGDVDRVIEALQTILR